ncbi:MAG: hypothetical protein FH748_04230 [Balneolaceae bacterium]|nr:hypothetical protein [Balneolaceae bacterium]
MKHVAYSLLALTISFCSIACESTFEPIDESKGYNFSMYGTLNVEADTQWVRVMPVGETLIPSDSSSNGTVVTITRVSTGDTTVMNDSLFVFRYGQALAWNYWTTEKIYPNEVYRIDARNPEGKTSFAIVETPSQLEHPLVQYSGPDARGIAKGSYSKVFVEVSVKYIVEFPLTVTTEKVKFSLLNNVEYSNEGNYSVSIPNGIIGISSVFKIPESRFRIVGSELIIASGGKDWPDLSNLSEEEIFLPESVKNVENGVGLVAGVALLRMPLKSCYNDEGVHIPCEPLN